MGKSGKRTPSGIKSIAIGSLIDVSGMKTYRAARRSMPTTGAASISGSFRAVANTTTPRQTPPR